MSKGSVNVPDIPDAGEVGYSNTKSKLKAETAQDAIDELSGSVDDLKPILRDSDPTAETVGKLGQHCINTTKGTEWTCVGINGDVYTWTQGGGGSSAVDLVRIKIATPPTKTAYKAGETFDPTGMVVTADYAIGGLVIIEDKPVTGYVYPTAALAAGTASIVISYTEDGETKTAEQAISVTKTSVTIPTYKESRSYNGNVQTPSFTNENSAYMTKSGDVTGQNAGDYAALFDLNDSDLYQWSDGTITQKSVPWRIAKANPTVTAPTAKTLTYNGSDQALVNAGSTDGGTMQYSTDGTTWSGSVPSGHNAGSYAVRYRVAGGTNYNDNAGGTVQVTIAQKATTLTLDKASVTLNADNLTAAVNITTDGDGALSAESSASGVASASISGTVATITHVNRASGTATITIKQAAGTNYKAASKTVSVTADFFSATLNVTAVPGATVTATSGGNSYSGTANSSGIASIAIGQSGTYSVTGSYQDAASNTQSVAVTQDGGTYSTTLSWITLALTAPNGSSVTLTNGTKTFTGTGTGSAVTYYLPATGTWTATATLDGESTSGSVSVTAYTAYSLTLAFIPENFSDATWAQVAAVGAEGKGAQYWDIGDTHPVTLNGNIGLTSYSNKTMHVFIAHFNYKSQNGIYVMGFMDPSTNKVLGLCDSKYNSNAGNTGDKYFAMNHWGGSSSPYNTNYGGWAGCDLRYDILGSTNKQPSGYGSTPTTSRVGYDPENYDIVNSPVANTLMAAYPSDLRKNMKPFTVYTDNKGNSSTAAAAVTASVDYIVLPAEYEVFGTTVSYANENEPAQQEQLEFYRLGNSKITYKDTDPATAVYRWERSPSRHSASGFALVTTGGSSSYNDSRLSYALTPLSRVA